MTPPRTNASGRKNTRMLLKDLGWTNAQVEEARSRLSSFEPDWDHPGMEKYDAL